jgi:hypothetical protein
MYMYTWPCCPSWYIHTTDRNRALQLVSSGGSLDARLHIEGGLNIQPVGPWLPMAFNGGTDAWGGGTPCFADHIDLVPIPVLTLCIMYVCLPTSMSVVRWWQCGGDIIEGEMMGDLTLAHTTCAIVEHPCTTSPYRSWRGGGRGGAFCIHNQHKAQ